MTMLLISMAITKMANRAILAIMATIAMANGNFCMVINGMQLKSTKEPAQ